jgi:nucleoside-diphosphate-sugar epimerase
MKVLVTGASGFVGRHLVPELAQAHDVVCVLRDPASAHGLDRSRVIEADLTDPHIARKLPEHTDVVVHLAQAYLDFPDHASDLFLVNAASTHWLAEYARTSGASRFVFASSGSVYRPSSELLREDAATAPTSYHPATKLISEQLLQHYDPFFTVAILRLFAPYGPGQVDRLLPRMIQSVRSGSPVVLSRGGEPRINPIYITDLVRIVCLAVEGGTSYTINVAGPESASIRELAEIIGRLVGRSPVFEERDNDSPGSFVADTTLMRRLLNVDSLVPLDEGLRAMVGVSSAQAI